MKLHTDTLQFRVEELEKEKSELFKKYSKMQEQTARRTNDVEEIMGYKKQIADLSELVRTYEEHNLKIPQLEKKLRSQKAKYEGEIKTLDDSYKEKIAHLNKKFVKLEETYKATITKSKLHTLEDDLDQVNVILSFKLSITIAEGNKVNPEGIHQI
jgi:chromosome segregation ATPase